jgi:hypothetical protein
MSISKFVRLCTIGATSAAVALSGSALSVSGQSLSEVSMRQAGYNAGQRLVQEGYEILSIDGAPHYGVFLRSGEVDYVSVDIPRTGKYVLVVGGDNDTRDLDLYFPQIDAYDTSYGLTGFVEFTVYRPGRFVYQIDMLNCGNANCGVFAVLLAVRN